MTLKPATKFPGAEHIVVLGTAHAERLADRWRSATAYQSLRGPMFSHPAFAEFAALGDAAIAVAIDRLADPAEVELWLDVLEEIADGPSTSASADEPADAWRRWAGEQGIVP